MVLNQSVALKQHNQLLQSCVQSTVSKIYPAASRCLSVRKWPLANIRKDIHEILYRTVVVAFIHNIEIRLKTGPD